jgi:hypothetical protein
METNSSKLVEEFGKVPLSTSLRKAMHLANHMSAIDLSTWCRLELGGYLASNPAMADDITVPEYRTVIGQHVDIFGQVLILPSDLSFMSETRLRNGVEELELLSSSRDIIAIHDPYMCELIKQHLDVEVYLFQFSRIHLIGVLTAIRTKLEDQLQMSNPAPRIADSIGDKNAEDIIELKPNFYGIGINLRALWRRWKNR